MERLNIYEYKKLLESDNYNISPDKLKILTERLSGDINYDLSLIKDDLVAKGYDASIASDDDQSILDIYLSFSGLQFIINENNKLVLIEEMWYQNRGMYCDKCDTIIGEPSLDNIIKIIDLYCTDGRANNGNSLSIEELLSK